jgi:hypothetical protein
MLKQKAKVPFRREQDGTAISIAAQDSTKQDAHPQMRHSRASGDDGRASRDGLANAPWST